MKLAEQQQRAEAFHRLHHAAEPLILFNCWDVATARVIARSFPAIATSSGAVSSALGYEDGQNVPLAIVTHFVARLTAAVAVPVSLDFEAGYGDTPEAAAASVAEVVKAGAIGINLEDGLVGGERRLVEAGLHAAKIRAIRAAASELGVRLFINARIDSFWLKVSEPEECLAIALERGPMYVEAGADGLFVPGLVDLALIARLAAALPLPLNIMAVPGAPSIAELHAAGAQRISSGAWPMIAATRVVAATASAVAATGSFAPLES
jgi:2-methylisocitrate lyase-like PEP mutase family enzyme